MSSLPTNHNDGWRVDQTNWNITKFLQYLDKSGVEYTMRVLRGDNDKNKFNMEFQFRNSPCDLDKVLDAAVIHLATNSST